MIDLISSSSHCNHCRGEGHGDIVCNCGHTHNQHVFLVGCAAVNEEGVKVCQCNRYNQTKLRKFDETNEEFYNRTGITT